MGQPVQGIPAQDMLQGVHALQMGSLGTMSSRYACCVQSTVDLSKPVCAGGVAMGQPVQGIPAQGMHAQQMGGLSAMGFLQTDANGASSSGTGIGLTPLSPVPTATSMLGAPIVSALCVAVKVKSFVCRLWGDCR